MGWIMKRVKCNSCGADDVIIKNGFLVCSYCRSKFAIEQSEKHIYNSAKNFNNNKTIGCSSIALDDDVQRLLDKCKKEPRNARRYANLILDIDPDNIEALKYL